MKTKRKKCTTQSKVVLATVLGQAVPQRNQFPFCEKLVSGGRSKRPVGK